MCVIVSQSNRITKFICGTFHNCNRVVCVGGDGIVNEAVHGLLLRAQRDAGVTISTNTPMAKCRIPLGIIPVGK